MYFMIHQEQVELSLMEILNKSIKVYMGKIGFFLLPYLIVNACCVGFQMIFTSYLPYFNPPQEITEAFLIWATNYIAVLLVLNSLIAVITWTITAISSGIVTSYISKLIEKGSATYSTEIKRIFSKIPTLLIAGFVVAILTTTGLIMLVLPGIVVTIVFSLTIQVMVIEDLGILSSLKRSRELVAHRWMKTFAVLAITTIAVVAVSILAAQFEILLQGSLKMLGLAVSLLFRALAQPMQPIALSYLYYSLRSEKQRFEQEISRVPRWLFLLQKFCCQCGQRLPTDAIFCPQCGDKVRSEKSIHYTENQ